MPTQMPRKGRCFWRTTSSRILDHAGHGIEPAPAIGEGADAGQHDAIGPAHLGGSLVTRMVELSPDSAPRARKPWRPSAGCPSRNR
jgi:hypothetical protein